MFISSNTNFTMFQSSKHSLRHTPCSNPRNTPYGLHQSSNPVTICPNPQNTPYTMIQSSNTPFTMFQSSNTPYTMFQSSNTPYTVFQCSNTPCTIMFRELRFLIHQSIAGGVIGKGGEKIKEIRQTSGAGVKVQIRWIHTRPPYPPVMAVIKGVI